jgi:hypothetical protein
LDLKEEAVIAMSLKDQGASHVEELAFSCMKNLMDVVDGEWWVALGVEASALKKCTCRRNQKHLC